MFGSGRWRQGEGEESSVKAELYVLFIVQYRSERVHKELRLGDFRQWLVDRGG
jgi:hypothetical protein